MQTFSMHTKDCKMHLCLVLMLLALMSVDSFYKSRVLYR